MEMMTDVSDGCEKCYCFCGKLLVGWCCWQSVIRASNKSKLKASVGTKYTLYGLYC